MAVQQSQIEYVYRCQCGGVGITVQGVTYYMKAARFRKEFPGFRPTKKQRHPHKLHNCDYCVNHYGIDICGCGSGEPAGQCDGEFDECRNKTTSQSLDELIAAPGGTPGGGYPGPGWR